MENFFPVPHTVGEILYRNPPHCVGIAVGVVDRPINLALVFGCRLLLRCRGFLVRYFVAAAVHVIEHVS